MPPRAHRVIAMAVISLAATACASEGPSAPTTSSVGSSPGQITTTTGVVAPIAGGEEFLVQVVLTDRSFEPSMIMLPAGRRVRLVLRNRGTTEHHFRIKGLIPAEMRWLVPPELDISTIDEMSDTDLAALGLAGAESDDGDVEHLLHHLEPMYVPHKEMSPAGVKPLPTEVHGYAVVGDHDVLSFYPLTTGRFEVEDVLHPEITGTVVVFTSE